MRYLLVIGFACDVYRQNPRSRIFFDNKLIDEFYIQNNKDTLTPAIENFFLNNYILKPSPMDALLNLSMKNFAPLRFYEIEVDQTKNQQELRIEIKNNDSNYNNGFMTNSTLLRLQVCHFFPLNKELLARLVKIRKKNLINQKYAWFRSNKNTIFKLIENGIEWNGENTQTVSTTNNLHLNLIKIGGSGYFSCKLVKKYGIFITKLYKSYRYNLINTSLMYYFINKYEQYANQRNTD